MPNEKAIVHTGLVTNLMRIKGRTVRTLPRFEELYSNQPLPASPKVAQMCTSGSTTYPEMQCHKETLQTSRKKPRNLGTNILLCITHLEQIFRKFNLVSLQILLYDFIAARSWRA